MAKPSEDMKNKIKGTGLMSPGMVDWYAAAFHENYKFNQEPPQEVINIMFEAYISGALTSQTVQACGPSTRCSTCTGQCGKCLKRFA